MKEDKKLASQRWVPYQWFWKDEYDQKMTFISWLKSRPFSIFYIVTIWTIVAVLDFASTRNCTDTWQLAFQCDQAIWMDNLISDPLQFIKSWFTTGFFHNGLDHILFVTIFGFLGPVQSFENQHGSKLTIIIFFLSYIFIGLYCAIIFNVAREFYPDLPIVSFAFERNWMGGSVALFCFIGALSYLSSKKWFLLSLVLAFESINFFVLNIDVHISFVHISVASFGWLLCYFLSRSNNELFYKSNMTRSSNSAKQ